MRKNSLGKLIRNLLLKVYWICSLHAWVKKENKKKQWSCLSVKKVLLKYTILILKTNNFSIFYFEINLQQFFQVLQHDSH